MPHIAGYSHRLCLAIPLFYDIICLRWVSDMGFIAVGNGTLSEVSESGKSSENTSVGLAAAIHQTEPAFNSCL